MRKTIGLQDDVHIRRAAGVSAKVAQKMAYRAFPWASFEIESRRGLTTLNQQHHWNQEQRRRAG